MSGTLDLKDSLGLFETSGVSNTVTVTAANVAAVGSVAVTSPSAGTYKVNPAAGSIIDNFWNGTFGAPQPGDPTQFLLTITDPAQNIVTFTETLQGGGTTPPIGVKIIGVSNQGVIGEQINDYFIGAPSSYVQANLNPNEFYVFSKDDVSTTQPGYAGPTAAEVTFGQTVAPLDLLHSIGLTGSNTVTVTSGNVAAFGSMAVTSPSAGNYQVNPATGSIIDDFWNGTFGAPQAGDATSFNLTVADASQNIIQFTESIQGQASPGPAIGVEILGVSSQGIIGEQINDYFVGATSSYVQANLNPNEFFVFSKDDLSVTQPGYAGPASSELAFGATVAPLDLLDSIGLTGSNTVTVGAADVAAFGSIDLAKPTAGNYQVNPATGSIIDDFWTGTFGAPQAGDATAFNLTVADASQNIVQFTESIQGQASPGPAIGVEILGVSNQGIIGEQINDYFVGATSSYVQANLNPNEFFVFSKDDLSITQPGYAGPTAAELTFGPTVSPSITGAAAAQSTTDEATIKPLKNVTVGNINSQANEVVTLTLTNGAGGAPTDANGTLSGTGLSKTGTGTYTLTAGSPAAVTSELDALIFTPTAHEVTPGQTTTTGVVIAVSDGAGTATDTTSSIVATAVNDAPAIVGTKAGQTTTDYVPIKPFTSASITDVDVGVNDSLTITLENGSGVVTDANGTLSGTGLTKTGVGTYALAATTPAALTTELEALTFTPTQHEVPAGQTVTTSFTLTASQTAGGTTVTTTNATTTVVATALNYIVGPARGFGVLIGTPGQDIITANGSFNVIYGEGGPDIINAGNGFAYVNLASGSATVTLGGSANIVTGKSGNVTVTGAPGGYTEVFLGNGNNNVQVGGKSDDILLGNGTNVVSGGQGLEFISTGSGNDTITLGGTGNQVNAGGGINVIHGGTGNDTFVLPPAGTGFDTITGFTELNGDVLDLRNALAATNWNGRSTTLANYVKVTDNSGSTTISIASKGTGAGTAIATLSGAGNLGLTDLVAHHSLLT
jgi:hypothetical protein